MEGVGATQGGAHVHPVCFVANNSDPHFLMVPCWKITLFVIVPVLGPLVALIICYNWLHRRLAGAVLGQHTGPLSWRHQASPNGKHKEGGWEQGSRLRAGMSFLLCPHGQHQTPQRIQDRNHLLRSAGSLSGRGEGRDYKVYREDVGGASHLLLITYFSLFSGQFLEELSKFSSICYKLRAKEKESSSKGKRGLLRDQNPRGKEGAGLGGGMSPPGG